MKKVRKIVSHFRHSEQACRHLLETQKSYSVPQHKLIQDIETRWNSTYLMLERVVEQRKVINLLSSERGGIDTLTNAEWELTERVVSILKPFYAATLEICADDSCISVVIPIVAMLYGKMQTTEKDQGLKQMKAALRDAMHHRFMSVRVSEPHITATQLDPRFKDAYFTCEEKEASTTVILEYLRSAQVTADSDTSNATTSTAQGGQSETEETGSEINTASVASNTESLWDDHDILLAAGQPSDSDSRT